jgi:DNA-binding CsgD family transcriptional regulator
VSANIVGRDEELAAIGAFVERADGGRSSLVLAGEAGIGKSTLWAAGVERAREVGLRVLVARPTEAESHLGPVSLGDLFQEVVEEVIPSLAPPRRRALEGTLLLSDTESGHRIDARTVAVAVRDALHILAERGPVLIGIDDVQWLDASSSGALAFAMRRLDGSAVQMLLARRVAERAQQSALEDFAPAERIRVAPLSVGALHRLLRDRLERPFARQTLLAIHERAGGNPFFALELARSLPDGVDLLTPLPVPETLDQLVRSRLGDLPRSTRDALALSAAFGTPPVELLERASIEAGALDPAIAAHVIDVEDGNVRFTHPLLSSILYADLGDGRRAVHERLAAATRDPVTRAHHLALATEEPDDEVVRVLDHAVAVAEERGASALAANLAEHALRLTAGGASDDRQERALAVARAYLASGEWTRARAIAEDVLIEAASGPLRAEALLLLAEFHADDLAVPVLEESLREARTDPLLEARVGLRLAIAARFRNGFASVLEAGRAVLDLADGLGDEDLQFEALVALVVFGSAAGDAQRPSHVARLLELAAASGDPEWVRTANVCAASSLPLRDDFEGRRATLEEELAVWCDRDELVAADIMWELAWLELWTGRWGAAAAHADSAREIRAQYGDARNQDFIPIAWIALHSGDLQRASVEAEEALRLCEEQVGFDPPLLVAVPGIVALWSGDPAAAGDALGEADRQAERLGWRSAESRPWTPEHTEALLEVGEVEQAVALVDRWEADAERLGSQRVLAAVRRCRGLVHAAQGAVDEAALELDEAAVLHTAAGDRFGEARALFALGLVQRRRKQKRSAREALESALAGFEALGAATWVERARDELGRIGGRARQQGLTSAERRVAVLVAAGRTNREVAKELFLGERTVAGHLSHVYAKLGIRSRTELARRLD